MATNAGGAGTGVWSVGISMLCMFSGTEAALFQ